MQTVDWKERHTVIGFEDKGWDLSKGVCKQTWEIKGEGMGVNVIPLAQRDL